MKNGTPKLKRDWIGRHVKLRRQIETVGAIIFDVGEVLRVVGYYHGLKLETVWKCPHCRRRSRQGATRVRIADVELLPPDFVPTESP